MKRVKLHSIFIGIRDIFLVKRFKDIKNRSGSMKMPPDHLARRRNSSYLNILDRLSVNGA